MKAILTSITIVLVFILAHSIYTFIDTIKDVPDEHAGLRYERCMSAYEGTELTSLCDGYKK